jgi:hypothetical protein
MATTSHYLVAAGLADTIFLIVSLTTSRNDYFISLACRKGSCGNKLRDTSKFARALHREKQKRKCSSKSFVMTLLLCDTVDKGGLIFSYLYINMTNRTKNSNAKTQQTSH